MKRATLAFALLFSGPALAEGPSILEVFAAARGCVTTYAAARAAVAATPSEIAEASLSACSVEIRAVAKLAADIAGAPDSLVDAQPAETALRRVAIQTVIDARSQKTAQ